MADALPPPPPPPLPYLAPVLTPAGALPPALGYEVPRQLAAAEAAWRPVRKAIRYATFDAGSLAVFAVLSLPCAIGGVVGLLLAGVLGWCAVVEFAAVRQLKRLDPGAPRRLAMNQLVLGGGLVLYSLWNLALAAAGRGMLAELKAHQSELGDLGPQAAQLMSTVIYVVYGALAVLGVLLPGATALFYRSRLAHLQAYLAHTPAWIVQMQRERGTLTTTL